MILLGHRHILLSDNKGSPMTTSYSVRDPGSNLATAKTFFGEFSSKKKSNNSLNNLSFEDKFFLQFFSMKIQRKKFWHSLSYCSIFFNENSMKIQRKKFWQSVGLNSNQGQRINVFGFVRFCSFSVLFVCPHVIDWFHSYASTSLIGRCI